MNTITTMSREEISEGVISFRDWLESIQVATKGSRLPEIITATQRIIEAKDTQRYLDDLSLKQRGRIVESYFDAYAFTMIFSQIASLDPRILPRGLLKQAIQGPADPSEEIPGNATVNARNHMFELELACRFMASGHNIVGFDDIIVELGGTRINIQCKRIQRIENFRCNFERAVEQVKAARIKEQAHYGVVAVSLDRVAGTTTKSVIVPQADKLAPATRRRIRPYHANLRECLHANLDMHILGGMLDLKCFGIATDNAQPVLSRQSFCAGLDGTLDLLRPEKELFKLLIEKGKGISR